MASAPPRHQVEQFAIQALASGDGFVLDLANARQEAVRLEFPSWMLHQLMRVLPQLDAALHPQQRMASHSLIAYPVASWQIERSGLDPGVALCLRNDRLVETGFHFSVEEARAFHQALGEAITAAALRPAHGGQAASCN